MSQQEPLQVATATNSRRSVTGVVSTVTILVILWWTAAIFVKIGMRNIMSNGPDGSPPLFRFPFLFTALLNTFVCGWAILLSGAWSLTQRWKGDSAEPLPKLRFSEACVLLGIGVLQGAELGLTNTSLSLLSVSNQTCIMSAGVIIQMVISCLWRLEGCDYVRLIAGALLVGGGVIQAHAKQDSGQDTFWGYIALMGSLIVSGNRWALTQHIFQRAPEGSALRRWTKVKMMPYMAPGTAVICFIMAAIIERNGFASLPDVAGQVFIPLLYISVCIMTLTVSELLIVQVTSAVVMVVLAAVHNIPIVVGGVLINHDYVAGLQWIGFMVCLLGAIVYFYARVRENNKVGPTEPAEEPLATA